MSQIIMQPKVLIPSADPYQYSSALEERFKAYLSVQDITVKAYMCCIRSFSLWLQENKITQPKREHIIAYTKWLSAPHISRKTGNQVTFSAGTQARYLRAVKMFFKWLEKQHLYENIADNIKGARVSMSDQKRDAFEAEDIRKILSSIDRTTETGARDYAMILLAVTAGLRIIEMQRANIGDIEKRSDDQRVIYIQGKGHREKDDYKKLPEEVYDAIEAYLQMRKCITKDAPLFAAVGNRSHGARIAEPSISRIIKNVMLKAGYDSHRLTAHSLRHSSVTFLLDAGATIQEAQQHARHANINTTMIYAHNMNKKKAHDEQRVYDYLFGTQRTFEEQAQTLLQNMPAAKKDQALQLLAALAR